MATNKCAITFLAVFLLEGLAVGSAIIIKSPESEEIKEKYTKAEIVPTVLNDAPTVKLSVAYNGSEVNFGNEFTTNQTSAQPNVIWTAEANKYYTLSMVDPDAPSRTTPTFRSINHWLVINIRGNDVSTGDILSNYRGPRPPAGSGFHRYILNVFEQPDGNITVIQPKLNEVRTDFSIRRFANQYGLTTPPLAGNFYQVQTEGQ